MPEASYVAEGAKTRIRRFVRADVDRWLAWARHSDPLFESYDPPTMSSGMRDTWFDDLVGRQGQLPFAVDSFDGALIGRVFLRHQHRPAGTATLGIDLDPRYLDRGYGTDALEAFLPYFFGKLGFERMYLSVATFNGRARHVYRRMGFRDVNEHWERVRTSAPVLRDRRYAPIKHLFRQGAQGLEALHHLMVLDRATHQRAEAEPASPDQVSERA